MGSNIPPANRVAIISLFRKDKLMKFYIVLILLIILVGYTDKVVVDRQPEDTFVIDKDYLSYVSEDEYFKVVTYV